MPLFRRRRQYVSRAPCRSRAHGEPSRVSPVPQYGGPHPPHPARPPAHAGMTVDDSRQFPCAGRSRSGQPLMVSSDDKSGRMGNHSRCCQSGSRSRKSAHKTPEQRDHQSPQYTQWSQGNRKSCHSVPVAKMQQAPSSSARRAGSAHHSIETNSRAGQAPAQHRTDMAPSPPIARHRHGSDREHCDRRMQADVDAISPRRPGTAGPRSAHTGPILAGAGVPCHGKKHVSCRSYDLVMETHRQGNCKDYCEPEGRNSDRRRVPLRYRPDRGQWKTETHSHANRARPCSVHAYADYSLPDSPVMPDSPVTARSGGRPSQESGAPLVFGRHAVKDCCEAGSIEAGPNYGDGQDANRTYFHFYQPMRAASTPVQPQPQPPPPQLATQQHFNTFVPPAMERYMPRGLAGSEALLGGGHTNPSAYKPLVNALVYENRYYQQLLADQQDQLYSMATYQNFQPTPWLYEPQSYAHADTSCDYVWTPEAVWQAYQNEVIENSEWCW